MTGVRSRFVCAGAAMIMICLAVLPKVSAIVAAMPPSVLGGAALVLFGMVAATGIRSLATAGLDSSRENLLVVAVSLGVGLVPTLSEKFLQQRLRARPLHPQRRASWDRHRCHSQPLPAGQSSHWRPAGGTYHYSA
jgi:xanthine/uracil permease